ncbi:hypothetical protein DCAR_0831072 [Daucus carota subsp. sativus]|uniref:Uncharacterized protein n=1 Tax=Daucus carota subsp. sativus TaxID=79200 RepID=A0AAF0XQU1_DAUCS|nr:hypothetical protein DCAR_0831072 [Daucus carota subsp. sativus]
MEKLCLWSDCFQNWSFSFQEVLDQRCFILGEFLVSFVNYT